MLRSRRFLAVGALWFSLAACGSSDDGTGTGGQAGTAGSGGSGGSTTGVECDPSGEVDLDGVFALRAALSFTFSSQPGGAVTICPVDQVSDGSFLGLVRVEHEPGTTDIKSLAAVVCTLELPIISAGVGECKADASNLVHAGLEFPQALVDAFPLAVTATTTAQMSGLAPGSSVTPGPMRFSIGTDEPATTAPSWQMDESGCGMNDNAPGRTSACETDCVTDCSLLVDDDGDGWPGVTVHVCGFTDEDKAQKVPCNALEPSIAGATIQGRAAMNLQVEPLLLMGQALSSCEVAGSLDASFSYNVVGSDLYLANTQISVTGAVKSLPLYTVNTDDSHFRLVRIDGKHGAPDWSPDFDDPLTTCREVIKHKNELY
jgi:hypothetical protein